METRVDQMHGSSYEGDCARLLTAMADVYEQRLVPEKTPR